MFCDGYFNLCAKAVPSSFANLLTVNCSLLSYDAVASVLPSLSFAFTDMLWLYAGFGAAVWRVFYVTATAK